MAVKIRLQRHGKKNFAFFHIVVADSRSPRDGRYIEQIGSYNPNTNPATIVLNSERALAWLKVGAEPTLTARRILSYEGVLLRHHLDGGVAKGALTQEAADKKWNDWKAQRDAKVEAKVSGIKNAAIEAKKAAKAEETKVNEARAEALAKKAAEAAAAAKAAEAAEAAEEAAEAVAEEAAAEAPAEEAAEAPADRGIMLQIAKILKSNGTDGGLLIGVRDIEVGQIDLQEPVFIEFDGLPVPFFIQDLQQRGTSKAIIHLNDITSLADDEEVVGRGIFIEGEWEEEEELDFTGWTLLNRGERVGTVTGMEPIPGNLCLYIGETLVPLHEDLIRSADAATRTLDLDLPEGLL